MGTNIHRRMRGKRSEVGVLSRSRRGRRSVEGASEPRGRQAQDHRPAGVEGWALAFLEADEISRVLESSQMRRQGAPYLWDSF